MTTAATRSYQYRATDALPLYALKRRKAQKQRGFRAKSTYGHCIKDEVLIDPVCGSGHCHIVPYWADRLGKKEIVAYQASERGGTLYCRMDGDRIFMAGKAVLFSEDEILL